MSFDPKAFDSESRARLSLLADRLIPEQGQYLSASQANVGFEWLDAVLNARADLVEPLREILENAEVAANREHQPSKVPWTDNFVSTLRAEQPDAFGVLTEVVSGAYFMNPQVRAAIGYSGQDPREIDPRPDYMEDGLLESVIRRGAIYRPTPETH